GKGALKILEIINDNESFKEKIIKDNYFIKAEIIYCLRYELTIHLIDLFCRRTEMSLWIAPNSVLEAAKKVAELMAKEYNWEQDRKTQEISEYIAYVKKTISFI
ncbi:MAG: glycerol-3-phosphate dehydrogenase C-terminal domain-containing protein, partial [Candidatus Thorarchaeota archaeon]